MFWYELRTFHTVRFDAVSVSFLYKNVYVYRENERLYWKLYTSITLFNTFWYQDLKHVSIKQPYHLDFNSQTWFLFYSRFVCCIKDFLSKLWYFPTFGCEYYLFLNQESFKDGVLGIFMLCLLFQAAAGERELFVSVCI